MAASNGFGTCSKEMINVFHSIDRDVYTKLVMHLHKDPEESMQVLALWLWLEQSSHGFMNIVERIRLLPENIISAVAEESVLCLKCIESDMFPFSSDAEEIPLLQGLSEDPHDVISLRYFHENRLSTGQGVSYMNMEVCLKACDDIMTQVIEKKQTLVMGSSHSVASSSLGTAGGVGAMGQDVGLGDDLQTPVIIGNDVINGSIIDLSPSYPSNYNAPGAGVISAPSIMNSVVPAATNAEHAYLAGQGYVAFDPENWQIVINEELGGLMSRLHLPFDEEAPREGEQTDEVAPDDRTIFLTFSKGYPISKEEVRNFFTRRHGDIIEAILMQDLKEGDQQVLYARLVVHQLSMIDLVLEGKTKAKFVINGKHVWARKFVKRAP
ncbi:hypothetical protein RJ641_036233 [Dillenia turbinata]|uniref:RRM domain-containing protein n=1 Tax=Dillenia turbinata TaxID=194707 RepID=A0AAN8VPF9_9MAGN